MTNENPLDKLSESFSSGKGKEGVATYRHPDEGALLQNAQALLQQSGTGAELLAFSEQNQVEVRLIKNKSASGYIPQSKVVYIGAPVTGVLTPSMLALLIAGGIREAQQELKGFMPPDETKDLQQHLTINHAKRADVLYYQCAVAYEINESAGNKEILDEMRKIGHGLIDIYIDERLRG